MFELYQKSHELLSQVLLQTCTSKSSNHLGAVNYIYNNLCYDAKGCCQEAQAAKDEDDKCGLASMANAVQEDDAATTPTKSAPVCSA
mmetsp:Transcript_12017/g.18831  ORF Transcript_12017/g.18831 Transcript_12017/m.18831 type:complete len:87 (+) Transcript_12017:254-514(+)